MIALFRDGWRIGVRVLRPDDERGCERGAAVSFKIGLGLYAPELRFEWGAWYRQHWHDRRTGRRVDFGYGFDLGEWVNPYGLSGRRWDRVIRFAMMRRRNAAERRRAAVEAAAAEIAEIPF